MFLEQGTLDIIEGFIGWKWCVGEPKMGLIPKTPLAPPEVPQVFFRLSGWENLDYAEGI